MMYFRSILGNLASLVTLVLLLLCLFAGSSRQFLPNAHIMRIDTSHLAPKNAPDFLNVYMMSYCYGFETECLVDGATNATTTQSTIKACSDQTALFRLDPAQAIVEAMGNGGDKADVGWPSYLTDDFSALALTSQAMNIFFILGTSTVGLSILLRLAAVRYIWQPQCATNSGPGSDSPPDYPGYPEPAPADSPPSKLQLLMSLTSTFFLTIAAIIASIICTQFIALLNLSGEPSEISAGSNSNFLGMAWTAVVIQTLLTTELVVALLQYRARHCRCEWESLPAGPSQEEPKPYCGGH